jgi:hypothetical protein
MQVNLAKIVFVILSVFLLKISVADTLRENHNRTPSSSVTVTTGQGIR